MISRAPRPPRAVHDIKVRQLAAARSVLLALPPAPWAPCAAKPTLRCPVEKKPGIAAELRNAGEALGYASMYATTVIVCRAVTKKITRTPSISST